MCREYLDAKKIYVERLNNVIISNPNLWDDVMIKNFDRADKLIDNNVILEWSESSTFLERAFFYDSTTATERIKIAKLILFPSKSFLFPDGDDRDSYLVNPPPNKTGNFLLIRKYDLPFIRDFLRLIIINTGHLYLKEPGFEGLGNSKLFNKILEIKGDKFVLHSGVDFGFLSKARAQQHCPLIVSLIELMQREPSIPFDSNFLPEVRRCIDKHEQQNPAEVEEPDGPDGDVVIIEKAQLKPSLSTELPEFAFRSDGGRRTKNRKLLKRVARIRRTRRTRRTRKSLRKH
jgi:hypothetical protein